MNTELKKAEYIWSELSRMQLQSTREVDKVLSEEVLSVSPPSRPQGGWLRACREAQLLTQGEMATRLKMSQQAYAKLESHEISGSLSLESLQKAAAAMECDFICFLRPKAQKKFLSMIWENILPSALKVYKMRRSRQAFTPIKAPVLGRIASDLFQNPQFRRKMKWVRKTTPSPLK